ncbi:peptide chain release factor 3 [bacterium]|nr:peptide chain release factor 3 [bacterium]
MSRLLTELERRRTFGIISHPDAGKTTLTEKLLLFGGAIQVAGAVKAKKASRHATSDFMEIERQRGISVATSVMGFEYNGIKINLLDTPGHQDFCEDTYRTLTAVDSALMVIDSSKGVESQTYKLLEVCRMRHSPIMTFINKMDRDGKPPIELLDEIEDRLNMVVCPMSWPIGSGKLFKGVYSLVENRLVLFKAHGKQDGPDSVIIESIDDPRLDELVGTVDAKQLRDDVMLVTGVYPPFDLMRYLSGEITPVFFGSALNNFGVREILDFFVAHAPGPKLRESTTRDVRPIEEKFSGFVFKIHANIDPKHRDRIAFLRIVSGVFERSKRFLHVPSGRLIKCNNPTAFMAQDKSIIDEAFPGDIIGLHDTGTFKIGDTLTEGEVFSFKGIPSFSPEMFRYCVNLNPLKTKQLHKGLEQLCEEGVAQLFTMLDGRKIVGTVGALQFEVIQYRLDNEYGAQSRFDALDFVKACWIRSENTTKLADFVRYRQSQVAQDKDGQYVYLAQTRWSLDREVKENPEIEFLTTSE